MIPFAKEEPKQSEDDHQKDRHPHIKRQCQARQYFDASIHGFPPQECVLILIAVNQPVRDWIENHFGKISVRTAAAKI